MREMKAMGAQGPQAASEFKFADGGAKQPASICRRRKV